jgi:hypothetical protein
LITALTAPGLLLHGYGLMRHGDVSCDQREVA